MFSWSWRHTARGGPPQCWGASPIRSSSTRSARSCSWVLGPNLDDFGGPLVITVDGSEESEAALPLGVAWAVELGTTPWIVHATKSSPPGGDGDVTDAVYLARLASELREAAHHAVEFDELHDEHPVAAVCAYAERHEVSLIVASSHGRSGLSRLTMGSVTSGFVRHAPCPVLVFRLPHPPRVSPA